MIILDFIKNNWIEIIGASFGLLYLYFEYQADIKMWLTGIIMSTFYTYVFIDIKFYAFAGINIYYILAGIYGWVKWYKPNDNNDNSEHIIVHTPTRLYLPLLVSICILFAFISWMLSTFTDSQVVYGDSFITTLSIVSMWMLAHKYVEQWLLLVVLNTVSTIIYFYQELYPTSIMYFIFAIASVFGYIKWKRLVIH